MKFLRVLTVMAALVVVCGSSKPSQATGYYSFGYYGPGISIYTGHYPRHYYPHHYYRHGYYYGHQPYYYGHRKRYTKRRYRRSHRYRKYAGRCSRWSRRCSANWGYGNRDYRGCMKYHGCR